MATATASGSDGSVRAVARERTRGKRESEGEGERCGAVRGVVQGVQGDEREKQEVAGDVAAGERARDMHSASRHEEEDRGGGGLGWPTGPARPHSAGPAQELAAGKFPFFPFCFLFYFSDICFDLIIILNHFIFFCQFL